MGYSMILGILLLMWVAYDLVSGSVWLHRQYQRQHEPVGYWCAWLLWLAVALSCFYWPF